MDGTDLAGNVSSPITHSFTVDLTPPTISLSATDPAGSTTSDTTNAFTFSANESASFQCNLDSAGFSACASPFTVSGLADGNHLFQVQATDLAGNMSTTSLSLTVSTILPVASGVSASVAKTSITVSWTTNIPASSQLNYGLGNNTNLSTSENMTLSTSHSMTISGLTSNTVYTVLPKGHSASGLSYTGAKVQVRTSP